LNEWYGRIRGVSEFRMPTSEFRIFEVFSVPNSEYKGRLQNSGLKCRVGKLESIIGEAKIVRSQKLGATFL
jgi:hypothetical protein